MNDDTETLAFKLINTGASLIVLGIIAIVFLVPFFASPTAFEYRSDHTIFEGQVQGPLESGILFCHSYAAVIWPTIIAMVLLGTVLARAGRRRLDDDVPENAS